MGARGNAHGTSDRIGCSEPLLARASLACLGAADWTAQRRLQTSLRERQAATISPLSTVVIERKEAVAAECPNRPLITLLRQAQVVLLATNTLIPLHLGMPDAEPYLLSTAWLPKRPLRHRLMLLRAVVTFSIL
jgi:hypothetical protein